MRDDVQPACDSNAVSTTLSLDECVSDCLDTSGCKAVVYDNGTCSSYTCLDYNENENATGTYVRRNCTGKLVILQLISPF